MTHMPHEGPRLRRPTTCIKSTALRLPAPWTWQTTYRSVPQFPLQSSGLPRAQLSSFLQWPQNGCPSSFSNSPRSRPPQGSYSQGGSCRHANPSFYSLVHVLPSSTSYLQLSHMCLLFTAYLLPHFPFPSQNAHSHSTSHPSVRRQSRDLNPISLTPVILSSPSLSPSITVG